MKSNEFLKEAEIDQVLTQVDSTIATQPAPGATVRNAMNTVKQVGGAVATGINNTVKNANRVQSSAQQLGPGGTQPVQAPLNPNNTLAAPPPKVLKYAKDATNGIVATQGTGTPEVDQYLKSIGLLAQ